VVQLGVVVSVELIVAFLSAKERPFAERKATECTTTQLGERRALALREFGWYLGGRRTARAVPLRRQLSENWVLTVPARLTEPRPIAETDTHTMASGIGIG